MRGADGTHSRRPIPEGCTGARGAPKAPQGPHAGDREGGKCEGHDVGEHLAGADGMALARHPKRKDEDGRGGARLAPVRPGLLGA